MRSFTWQCSSCRKSFLDHFEDDVDLDSFDTDGLCAVCADEERRLTDAAFAADIQLPSDDGIPF